MSLLVKHKKKSEKPATRGNGAAAGRRYRLRYLEMVSLELKYLTSVSQFQLEEGDLVTVQPVVMIRKPRDGLCVPLGNSGAVDRLTPLFNVATPSLLPSPQLEENGKKI